MIRQWISICFMSGWYVILHAQSDTCVGNLNPQYLNSNTIQATYHSRGNTYADGEKSGFKFPFPSARDLGIMKAHSLWMGGFDDAGNLKLAYDTYPEADQSNFIPGPLTSIGTITDSVCYDYDHIWSVFFEDILLHRLDLLDNGVINFHRKSIFGWPAKGNRFFKNYYGAELPNDYQGLADFADQNGNEKYDPDQGDFPVVNIAGQEIIPDQIMWMIFNDHGNKRTPDQDPVRVEIQLTAFAFHCTNNELLNHTLFNRYKIINRAVVSLDSVRLGFWWDAEMGCGENDVAGSIPEKNTVFNYNYSQDGDDEGRCQSVGYGFPDVGPVYSMTLLDADLFGFVTTTSDTIRPLQAYTLLNGKWDDGSIIRASGDGYQEDESVQATTTLFSGDPRDPGSWAGVNVLDRGADIQAIASVEINRLNPGYLDKITTAHMISYVPGGGLNDQFNLMHARIDSLNGYLFDHDLDDNCIRVLRCFSSDCVWPGDFNSDGIADHLDHLYWSAMKNTQGPPRNGLVSWRGHYADDWNTVLPEEINFKHGDADGNGTIDVADLDYNASHYLNTTDYFVPEYSYVEGNEIRGISSPFDATGISDLRLEAGQSIRDLIGIAFEMEFDTNLFSYKGIVGGHYIPFQKIHLPHKDEYPLRIAMYQLDVPEIDVSPSSSVLQLPGTVLSVKDNIVYENMPDCTYLRLRNVFAMKSDGTRLELGTTAIEVCKQAVQLTDPGRLTPRLYPNPATHEFYIDMPAGTEMEIISLEGKILQRQKIHSSVPISISGIPAGMYIVRMPSIGGVARLVVN